MRGEDEEVGCGGKGVKREEKERFWEEEEDGKRKLNTLDLERSTSSCLPLQQQQQQQGFMGLRVLQVWLLGTKFLHFFMFISPAEDWEGNVAHRRGQNLA